MVPDSVARFRERYRAAEIGPRYTGVGHLLLTSTVSLAAIALALSRLRDVRPAEWLAVPLSFLSGVEPRLPGRCSSPRSPWVTS